LKDVEDHYDDKLGFESKVGSMQEDLNHLDQKKTKLLTEINAVPQLALALGKLLSIDDNSSIEKIKITGRSNTKGWWYHGSHRQII
jgi:hypothetical protein